MARQYLDDKSTSGVLDRQSGESENHGDRMTRDDPNSMGPQMRHPYGATSDSFCGRFDDESAEPEGMGQIHSSANDGYPYSDGEVLGSVPDRSTKYPGYPASIPSRSPKVDSD